MAWVFRGPIFACRSVVFWIRLSCTICVLKLCACFYVDEGNELTETAIETSDENSQHSLEQTLRHLLQWKPASGGVPDVCVNQIDYSVSGRHFFDLAEHGIYPVTELRRLLSLDKRILDVGTGIGLVPLELQLYFGIQAYGLDPKFAEMRDINQPDITVADLVKPKSFDQLTTPLLDNRGIPLFYSLDASHTNQVQRVCDEMGENPCFNFVLATHTVFRYTATKLAALFDQRLHFPYGAIPSSAQEFLESLGQNNLHLKTLRGAFASAHAVLKPQGELWIAYYAEQSYQEQILQVEAQRAGFEVVASGTSLDNFTSMKETSMNLAPPTNNVQLLTENWVENRFFNQEQRSLLRLGLQSEEFETLVCSLFFQRYDLQWNVSLEIFNRQLKRYSMLQRRRYVILRKS